MVYGSGKTLQDFIFITIGTGLGGAVILNREIANFPENTRPEGLGHFNLNPDGFTCSCGRRGCWEAQASLTGLLKNFESGCSPEEKGWDAKQIFDEAERGNLNAAKVVDLFFTDFARGLAVLNRQFHPEKLIIGGAVSDRGDELIDGIQGKLKTLDASWRGTIEVSRMGNEAGLIGAAYLCALKL